MEKLEEVCGEIYRYCSSAKWNATLTKCINLICYSESWNCCLWERFHSISFINLRKYNELVKWLFFKGYVKWSFHTLDRILHGIWVIDLTFKSLPRIIILLFISFLQYFRNYKNSSKGKFASLSSLSSRAMLVSGLYYEKSWSPNHQCKGSKEDNMIRQNSPMDSWHINHSYLHSETIWVNNSKRTPHLQSLTFYYANQIIFECGEFKLWS